MKTNILIKSTIIFDYGAFTNLDIFLVIICTFDSLFC